jgi:zinc protease
MTKRKFIFLYIILIAGRAWGQVDAKIDIEKLKFPVTKTILPNGLTVLLNPDHSVPTVNYQMWFRVGSKYEEPGFTGIAHLFEHMMFKGGSRYNETEFKKLFLANGVNFNAFTTYDYTGYYEDFPPDKLKLVFDMESDRIEHLALIESNLKSERDVVKEERRMRVDNSIDGLLNELMWSNAYQVHPYKWPVIGWMPDLDNLSLERCKNFFKIYYSVSNAVIAMSGDFDSDKTLALITEYYGRLPKVEVPQAKYKPEPVQTAERKLVVKKQVQSTRVNIGFHIVKQGEPDGYVLDLISNILSEGESSRLYRRLVNKEQLALGVDASSLTPQDPGLFEIVMHLKPLVDYEKVLPIIYDELRKLDSVTSQELEKSKNQIMRHWVNSMKTIHKKSYNLVLNEIVTGSYKNLFDDLILYQKVSLSDIKRVARKYFLASNRTVVAIVPESSTGKGSK